MVGYLSDGMFPSHPNHYEVSNQVITPFALIVCLFICLRLLGYPWNFSFIKNFDIVFSIFEKISLEFS